MVVVKNTRRSHWSQFSLLKAFLFPQKENWLFFWIFPFYLSFLTVHFQSCYGEKRPSRGDGLRSGQVWGGPPKLNFNFIIFWLLRTTGLKRSPFGQTSVRFQGEHHVKRTPGECWVTKFALTCLSVCLQTECIMGRCESGEFLSACFVLLLFLKFENTLKICNLPCPKLICVICVIRSRSIFRSRYDVRAY